MSALHPGPRTSVRPALIDWPRDADRRAVLAAAGEPCLLVIDPGAPIPAMGPAEDWTYRTADERDVAARLQALAQRPPAPATLPAPVLPEGLSPDEHRVANRLFASAGSFVARDDLPVDDLDAAIDRLRGALAAEGWAITTVDRAGFILDRIGEGLT